MSCCWIITWLNIYLAILFLLSSFTTFIWPKSICLLIPIPYCKQVYHKQGKKHLSVVIFVFCIVLCSEIFLSQNGSQYSMHCPKKMFLVANTTLIPQFWENNGSLNFLDNALIFYALRQPLKNLNTDFILGNCLFGSVKLTKNTDPDKYKYTGYDIGCDSRSEFLLLMEATEKMSLFLELIWAHMCMLIISEKIS